MKIVKPTIEEIKGFRRAVPIEAIVRRITIPKGVITAGKKLTGCIAAKTQKHLFEILEEQYARREKPTGILFDYNDPRFNVHEFQRELYIKQHNHMFRIIPLFIQGCEDKTPLIETITVLGINGSPRKGKTREIIEQEIERYWTGPYYSSEVINLQHIIECTACGGHQKNCKPECIHDDQFRDILPKVRKADVMIIGSPVYMDMPTPRTTAFLSRLTSQTKHNRRANIGKYATAISTAWCSGTKTVISQLNNALEMMGFTIQGRSSREYIELWHDGKTRGGVPEGYYWPE